VPEVQGRSASTNEYNVAIALDYYKIGYIFQYEMFGGNIRGGVFVDFLIFNPFAEGLEVYGDYWHSGQLGADDRLRQARIEQELGRPVKILWGNETETVEEAKEAVANKVR
jgi:hypothetical protein